MSNEFEWLIKEFGLYFLFSAQKCMVYFVDQFGIFTFKMLNLYFEWNFNDFRHLKWDFGAKTTKRNKSLDRFDYGKDIKYCKSVCKSCTSYILHRKSVNFALQWIGQWENAKYLLDVELNTLDEDADKVPIFGA